MGLTATELEHRKIRRRGGHNDSKGEHKSRNKARKNYNKNSEVMGNNINIIYKTRT